MSLYAPDLLRRVMLHLREERAETFAPLLAATGEEFAINTPLRAAAFLASIAVESQELARLRENMNYSAKGLLATFGKRFTVEQAHRMARKPREIANHAYGGRYGNTGSDDGWLFRGGGLIQITFLDNYRRAGQALCLPLVEYPELVEQPEVACRVSGWYWSDRKLNRHADAGKFTEVTRGINPALHALAQREVFYRRARLVLGIPLGG